MKLALSMVVVFGVVLMAGVSSAGFTYDDPVYINTSTMYAQGSMGSARAASNTVESIGCVVEAYPGYSVTVTCYARNSAGTSVSCTSFDPALANVATAIADSSEVTFTWNSSGYCTLLEVNTFSHYRPKTL